MGRGLSGAGCNSLSHFYKAVRTDQVAFYTWENGNGTIGAQIILTDSSGVRAEIHCTTKDGVRFMNS